MKSPAEYVQAVQAESPPYPGGALLTVAEAERAVAIALADADRYKTNVVGAVLRSKPSTPITETTK